MADTVQQVKDKLSIVDVAGQYVKLERSGASLRARCPFHSEKTPSFFVSPERGTYHCFGCGAGGDIFSFVEQVEGLDFKGALKVLAEKAGVPLVYERKGERDERARLFELMEAATIFYVSRLTEEARKYLKGRGLTEASMQAFRLGWAASGWSDLVTYLKEKNFTEKEMLDAGVAKRGERGALADKFRNRIVFPIADSAGRVVAFSGRSFGPHASPEAPKYLNSPETPLFRKARVLYGLDRAKLVVRKHDCAVLVEGQMDLVSSHQAGWGNTVAVSGTAFTPEHASLLKRMTDNLVLALDADPAGIKAAGRAARAALQGGLNVKVARLPEGMDPADLIGKEGKEAWSRSIREAKDIIIFLLDVLQERFPQQDKFRRAVESIVLPFLADVGSPIAREQYVREVADRLGVSERAVEAALARMPSQGPTRAPESTGPVSGDKDKKSSSELGRAKQAYAILLWESSLPKARIDVTRYMRELREAVGEEVYAQLEALPEEEKERLRFAAERLFGGKASISREAQELLRILLGERLSGDLAAATAALRRAEAKGDEEEAARLVEECKLYTARIAHLYAEV